MIVNLNNYKGDDKAVGSVLRNLRKARIRLNDAYELFDEKKDPKLIHGKNEALSDTEEILTAAINYWHYFGKLVEIQDK